MENLLKVWSTFTSLKNLEQKFRITNLPVRYHDVDVDLCMKYFVREESSSKAAGIPQSDEAMAEIRELIQKMLTSETTYTMVCSIDDGTDELNGDNIIGSSIVVFTKRDEPDPQLEVKSVELKNLFNFLHDISSNYDAMKENNLDTYYDDRGIVVHPDYRGRGIAQEFLKARRLLCKEHGVPMTGAWMTSPGTQKAGPRDGWETVCEINQRDYASKHHMTFEEGSPNYKYMIARA